LPFASPQTPKMPKTLRGSFDQALRPLPSVVKGVQACRLRTLELNLSLGQHHPSQKISKHGPRANPAAYAFESAAAFSFASYFLRAFLL